MLRLALALVLCSGAAWAAEQPVFAARHGALAEAADGRRAAVAYSLKDQAEADARAAELCGAACVVKQRFAGGQCLRAERGANGALVAQVMAPDQANAQGMVKEACRNSTGGACRFAYAGCTSPAGVKPRLLKLPAKLEPGVAAGVAVSFDSLRASLPEMAELARQRALSVVLERHKSGEVVPWNLPDGSASGSIAPRPMALDGQGRQCRGFTEQLAAQGKSASRSGQACRDGNGIWR